MAKREHPSITPELEEKLRDRLEELLDELDEVSDKRRRLSNHLGGHVRVVKESIVRVRRQLKGEELDQVELPGTELPAPTRDPLVAEILRVAGGIVTPRKAGAPEPAPLVWTGSHEDGRLEARVPAGRYVLERNQGTQKGWTAKWDPASGQGRGKLLAIAKPLGECQEACKSHHLDRAGDDLLEKGEQ